MAISIEKYVDISTSRSALVTPIKNLGGLVFTTSDMEYTSGGSSDESSENDMESLKQIYDRYEPTPMSMLETQVLFGSESDEYECALRYYSYLSPTGNLPSRMFFCKMKDGEKPSECFIRVNDTFKNFGSFMFLKTHETEESLLAEMVKVSAINTGLGYKYLFVMSEAKGDMTDSEVCARAENFSSATGTCYVLGNDVISGTMPMAILAAFDYENGITEGFMFKQFQAETPTVYSDTSFDAFRASHVNFYGRAQANGMTVDFYQRGLNTNGEDTGVYCNEAWFKNACAIDLFEMLLTTSKLTADNAGVADVRSVVLQVCGKAVSNGVFIAKETDAEDEMRIRATINTLGGTTEDAMDVISDVARIGYACFASLGTDDDGSALIRYYVYYGTSDSVKMIKGNDILL